MRQQILTIILGSLFLTMALLIGEGIVDRIAAIMFGVCLVGASYAMTIDSKSKKRFSEFFIYKFKIVRHFVGSVGLAVIVSFILSFFMLYIRPADSMEFIFSFHGFLCFVGITIVCFPVSRYLID